MGYSDEQVRSIIKSFEKSSLTCGANLINDRNIAVIPVSLLGEILYEHYCEGLKFSIDEYCQAKAIYDPEGDDEN